MTTVPLARNRDQAVSIADQFRADFPILDQLAPGGRPLIYLDHAATSQKPRQVLERCSTTDCDAPTFIAAPISSVPGYRIVRGRPRKAARFVGAASAREIVFTRNASEAIISSPAAGVMTICAPVMRFCSR